LFQRQARDRPGIEPNSDVEVMLDIEIAGAISPGASLAVYFAPNTGKAFVDVLSAAVHDNLRKPSVISISWGGPEDVPYTNKATRGPGADPPGPRAAGHHGLLRGRR
jgi:subtilase family serine protease